MTTESIQSTKDQGGRSEAYIDSPIGKMKIVAADQQLLSLQFVGDASTDLATDSATVNLDLIQECESQLQAYFAGQLSTFDLPLAPGGTDFEQAVWQELLKIPFGSTCSYLDIARQLDNPGAVRAVGAANGKNPIAIIVPCHRVIGSNGKLTGYAGGMKRKEFLLALEQPESRARQSSLF